MKRRLALCLSLLASPAIGNPPLSSSYTQHCSGCHGTDGSGVPEKGIPNLADAGLYAGTPDGRAYLVQVPGISQSRLDDAAASAMLNYVLNRFASAHLPRDFRPYTAQEVGVLRANKASDAARRRQVLLAHLASGAAPR
jgi:hypothetical protein